LLALGLLALTAVGCAGRGEQRPSPSAVHEKAERLAEPICSAATEPGTACRVRVRDLRPTQFALGLREVDQRAARLARLEPAALDKYLAANPEPVVIAPGGLVFMIDHHHLARALIQNGVAETHAVVEANLSRDADFWSTMQSRGWVYLCDASGRGPLRPDELPDSVDQLPDDPYRSLAGEVGRRHGFEASDTPFVEFFWANFFRPRMTIGDDFAAAVEQALALARSPAACGLPGYRGPERCAPRLPSCIS